jgi:hypothetical protein
MLLATPAFAQRGPRPLTAEQAESLTAGRPTYVFKQYETDFRVAARTDARSIAAFRRLAIGSLDRGRCSSLMDTTGFLATNMWRFRHVAPTEERVRSVTTIWVTRAGALSRAEIVDFASARRFGQRGDTLVLNGGQSRDLDMTVFRVDVEADSITAYNRRGGKPQTGIAGSLRTLDAQENLGRPAIRAREAYKDCRRVWTDSAYNEMNAELAKARAARGGMPSATRRDTVPSTGKRPPR